MEMSSVRTFRCWLSKKKKTNVQNNIDVAKAKMKFQTESPKSYDF